MASYLHARTGAGATSSNPSVGRPSGVSIGDILVIFCGGNSLGAASATGWTNICNQGQLQVLWKVADSGDTAGGSVSVSMSGNSHIYDMYCFKGVDSVQGILSIQSGGEGGYSAITPAGLNDLLIAACGANNDVSNSNSFSGATESGNLAHDQTTLNNDSSLTVSYARAAGACSVSISSPSTGSGIFFRLPASTAAQTFSDTFTRADSDTVGNSWEEDELAGAGARISTNRLEFSSSVDAADIRRTRIYGFGRVNTSAKFKYQYGHNQHNGVFSFSYTSQSRNAEQGLYWRIEGDNNGTTATAKLFDGATQLGSVVINLAASTWLFVRVDVAADGAMRCYMRTGDWNFTPDDLKIEVAARSQVNSDGGKWALGNVRNAFFADLTIYDQVQSAVRWPFFSHMQFFGLTR